MRKRRYNKISQCYFSRKNGLFVLNCNLLELLKFGIFFCSGIVVLVLVVVFCFFCFFVFVFRRLNNNNITSLSDEVFAELTSLEYL